MPSRTPPRPSARRARRSGPATERSATARSVTGDPGRASPGDVGVNVNVNVNVETEVDGSPGRVRLTLRGRPFAAAGRLFVLYDGECGFCRSVVIHLRRWDRGNRLVPVPLQDASAVGSALLRAVSGTLDLARELTLVDEATGSASRGGDAVLTLVDALPGGRVLRLAWFDPPFLWAIRTGYGLVARHRSRLAEFGLDAPAAASAPPPVPAPLAGSALIDQTDRSGVRACTSPGRHGQIGCPGTLGRRPE